MPVVKLQSVPGDQAPEKTHRGDGTGAVKADLNYAASPPFHHLLLSGSASLAQRHALLHILLSGSLRHEVNIGPDIHLFL